MHRGAGMKARGEWIISVLPHLCWAQSDTQEPPHSAALTLAPTVLLLESDEAHLTQPIRTKTPSLTMSFLLGFGFWAVLGWHGGRMRLYEAISKLAVSELSFKLPS